MWSLFRERGWRENDPTARADAADLVRRYGRNAYDIARRNARDERQHGIGIDIFPPSHRKRVRQAIRVLLGRDVGGNGPLFSKPDPLPSDHPKLPSDHPKARWWDC